MKTLPVYLSGLNPRKEESGSAFKFKFNFVHCRLSRAGPRLSGIRHRAAGRESLTGPTVGTLST